MEFSDYIIFADESGSPVLDGPDPTFPVFVLNCVLSSKADYADRIVPRLQRLKFDFMGHDQLVLHERDIRRQQKEFAFLQVDAAVRETFLDRMNGIVSSAEIDVIAAVIHKVRLAQKYADPWSPYEIALHFCMETLLRRLRQLGQEGNGSMSSSKVAARRKMLNWSFISAGSLPTKPTGGTSSPTFA